MGRLAILARQISRRIRALGLMIRLQGQSDGGQPIERLKVAMRLADRVQVGHDDHAGQHADTGKQQERRSQQTPIHGHGSIGATFFSGRPGPPYDDKV